MIIAIDLDGTIVRNIFPSIGEAFDDAKENIQKLKDDGHTIVIWTCRVDDQLQEAADWLDENEIPYDYINENTAESLEEYGTDSRKINADVYIDDLNIKGVPDWPEIYDIITDKNNNRSNNMATHKSNIQQAPEQRYFDNPVELRAAAEGDESRTIVGYAFKWDKLSHRIGGWFREKIDRNALEGVKLNEMDIVALFNHNTDLLLARSISGTLTVEADDTGLRYEFEAPNTTAGNDLLENVKRGDVRNSSFSFSVAPGGDAWEDDDEQGETRTILKFKRIYDVSPVVTPAYPDTTVAKRSHDEFKNSNDNSDPVTYKRNMARRRFNLMFNK